MSSNIEITRVCDYCNTAFLARTTTTRYCSHRCNQKHYKIKAKQGKIETSNKETLNTVLLPLELIKSKDYLTVKEVAVVLNCSVRTVYRYVKNRNIKAVKIGQRMIRIRKSDLDSIFN